MSPVGLCADGAWGGYAGPDGVIHVSTGGEDAATGHWWDPVATVEAALDLSVCDGRQKILVGTGEFPTHATLAQDGLPPAGCGQDQTMLTDGSDTPDFLLRVSLASDVLLADFATSGGRRAIRVEGGAASLDGRPRHPAGRRLPPDRGARGTVPGGPRTRDGRRRASALCDRRRDGRPVRAGGDRGGRA